MKYIYTHVTKMVSLLIGMRFLHTSLFNLNLFFYRKCDQPDLQVCRAIFREQQEQIKTERRDQIRHGRGLSSINVELLWCSIIKPLAAWLLAWCRDPIMMRGNIFFNAFCVTASAKNWTGINACGAHTADRLLGFESRRAGWCVRGLGWARS